MLFVVGVVVLSISLSLVEIELVVLKWEGLLFVLSCIWCELFLLLVVGMAVAFFSLHIVAVLLVVQ